MQYTVQQWLQVSEATRLANTAIFDPFSPSGDITCGFVRYISDERLFRIYTPYYRSGSYDMEADRILSGAGFLDFLFHLHKKEWISAQHLKDLMDCVTCWIYRDHGARFPQEFFGVVLGMNTSLDAPNLLPRRPPEASP